MLRIDGRVVARGRGNGTDLRAALLLAALTGICVTWLPHNAQAGPRIEVSAADPDDGVWSDVKHAPVRAENPTIAGLIRAGLARSPTFRELYIAIAERKGIVHVTWDWNLRSGLVGAVPHRITRTPNGTSYLRVLLRPCTGEDAVIATIAHELRHVVEMLDKGIPATSQRVFETEAAIETGDAVRRELLAMRAPRSRSTPRVLTVTRDSDRRPR